LLAEPRAKVEHPNEFSLSYKRHYQLDPCFFEFIEGGRFQLESIQLNNSTCGL
jgi:hypothetical protein